MGRVYQTTVVNAPMDEVWARIRNFHDMSWSKNVITSCEAVGDKPGDQIGARRILNGGIHETLLELSDLAHTFKYSIDDAPSPLSRNEVRDFVGVVKIRPVTADGTTFVEWSSRWEGSEEGTDFCNNVFTGLLSDMRQAFSGDV